MFWRVLWVYFEGPFHCLRIDCFCMLCLFIQRGRWHPHSSTVAWKIPWMEEPGRLQSMGSLRVEHDWATSLSLSTFMHWRRKWQPTPVFLLGESQGRGRLVGCSPWGRRVRHDWSDLAAAAAFSYSRKPCWLTALCLSRDCSYCIFPPSEQTAMLEERWRQRLQFAGIWSHWW